MRSVLLGALLMLVGHAAHAQANVCESERIEAEQTPPAAEDVRAYQVCLEKWRSISARITAELSKPPPERRVACDRAYTDWQATTQSDPKNYDAIVARLRAREVVDRCNEQDSALHPPPEVAAKIAAEDRRTAAQRDLRGAKRTVIVGSVLLGAGGIALTAVGGVGIATINRPAPPDSTEGNVFAVLGLAIGGAITGALAVTGALILGFGARQHARARHEVSALGSQ